MGGAAETEAAVAGKAGRPKQDHAEGGAGGSCFGTVSAGLGSGRFVALGNPIERLPAGMGYREHPESLLPDDVGQVIREYPKVDAAIGSRPEAVEFRVIGNPQNAPIHLLLETPSQSTTSILIVGDGIEKLVQSLIDKANRDGTKRFSAARLTSS